MLRIILKFIYGKTNFSTALGWLDWKIWKVTSSKSSTLTLTKNICFFARSGRLLCKEKQMSKLWLDQAKWYNNISKSGVLHLTGTQNGISGATYVGDKGAQLAPGGAPAIGQRVKRAGARFQFLHNCGLCSPFSANCWKPVNIGRRNWNGRLRNLISSCL